jgi:DNA-binding NarL/FixJ family response regulator
MSPISILIVEDQPIIQTRLTNLFHLNKKFLNFGVYSNAISALNYLEHKQDSLPDILLVDLELPGMKGDEMIKICLEKFPTIKIVVFTVYEDQLRILNLLQLGIKGYLLKDTLDDLLIAELRVVHLGGSSLTERVAQSILEELYPKNNPSNTHSEILTKREYEILNFIALGLNYRDIASKLDLSPYTIRRHIEKIYLKLEVNSKFQALNKAKKLGII